MHLTGGVPNGVPPEAADLYRLTGGIVNARQTLRAGYTTVRNPGSTGWSIFALRGRRRCRRSRGPADVRRRAHDPQLRQRPLGILLQRGELP